MALKDQPRQAIQTRYYGPTNTKGGRIRAWAIAGAIWHDWDHALSIEGNHREAALKLRERLGWLKYGPTTMGTLRGGDQVHVFMFGEG